MIRIKKVNNRLKDDLYRIIFFVFVNVVLCYFLYEFTRITLPLLFAYILYLITGPIVPFLSKFKLKKSISLTIVFTSIIFFIGYPVTKVIPIVAKETENFNKYLPKIESHVRENYNKIKIFVKEKANYELGDKWVGGLLNYGTNASKSILLILPQILAFLLEWILLVPLFLFFFLKDSNLFKREFLKIVPNTLFERFYYLFHQFNKQIGDYIFAKFIEAAIVGFILTIGLSIIGVRFSILLGLVGAITNVIPYVGPILGMAPALGFGLAEYGTGTAFWAIFFLYVGANAIDLGIVFPLLVSKLVNLHPVVVVTSVIIGSQLWGVMGMVISIPVAASLKLIFKEIYKEIYLSGQ